MVVKRKLPPSESGAALNSMSASKKSTTGLSFQSPAAQAQPRLKGLVEQGQGAPEPAPDGGSLDEAHGGVEAHRLLQRQQRAQQVLLVHRGAMGGVPGGPAPARHPGPAPIHRPSAVPFPATPRHRPPAR